MEAYCERCRKITELSIWTEISHIAKAEVREDGSGKPKIQFKAPLKTELKQTMTACCKTCTFTHFKGLPHELAEAFLEKMSERCQNARMRIQQVKARKARKARQ